MARKYRTYKFIYTDDLNQNSLRRQRVYLDENNQPITPITQLFLDRVIDFPEKITGTSRGLRALLTYIRKGKFIVKLPYSFEQSSLLTNHIQEILAVSRVQCADYLGENNITGGTQRDIQ